LNTGLYAATLLLLIISFYKDKNKTKMALKKAWKAFENILNGSSISTVYQ